MNDETVEIFKHMNIFDIFAEHGSTAPKTLKDVHKLQEDCINAGKMALAEFLDEWRATMEYYIQREHNDSQDFYV